MSDISTSVTDVSTISESAVKYTFGTLVTDFDQYNTMVESFRNRGFHSEDCEFIFADNTDGNKYDGYEGLNSLISVARGEFLILLHQDILAMDDRAHLDRALDEMEAHDPAWAVLGNAGFDKDLKPARCLTSPSSGYMRRIGKLPHKVETLDENFLVLRNSARLGFSRDLAGFHLYGTDLVQQAALRGWSAYVFDFMVEHLGDGTVDESFLASMDAFRKKYRKALSPKLLQTTITCLPFGRDYPKSKRHRSRIARMVSARTEGFDLRNLEKSFKNRLARFWDRRAKSSYKIDNVTFTIPPDAPASAMRALAKGAYEEPERRLISRWLQPDLPAVELGGSYGIVTNAIRRRLNPDQPLTVLEANVSLVPYCQSNALIENRGAVDIRNAALAYKAKAVRFVITDAVHTSHVSHTGESATSGQTVEVEAMTLGQVLADADIDDNYSLVCDIEGGEFDLFINDVEALKRCALVVVEIHPKTFVQRGESVSSFLRNLDKAGFEVVETVANVLAAKRRLNEGGNKPA